MTDKGLAVRTLLLTLFAPGPKYGCKIIGEYATRLGAGACLWASLQVLPDRKAPCAIRHESFTPVILWWRLRKTSFGWWLLHEAHATRLARRIAAWAREFDPEVLWVLPELGAAPVAWRLKELLRIPMHVTSHDAHETARELVPRLYYPFYARSVRRVLARADSLDAVSAALVSHHARQHANLREDNTLVFPPSTEPARMVPPQYVSAGGTQRLVRIGLCGSMRVTSKQWTAFLELLGRLPFSSEIVAFAYEDLFPNARTPANVKVVRRAFADTEDELVRDFHEVNVEACYLGLFKEENRRLFGRTSLSAKLTTYLAAGLPVIVDANEDSAAWQLMRPYDAGVLFDRDADVAAGDLVELFSKPDVWQRKAAGALRLCRERFDLDANMVKFRELLGRTAGKGG